MGARYTEGELASVREMVAGGMTDGEIAERLGRTPRSIESARWIHGIPRGGNDAGVPRDEGGGSAREAGGGGRECSQVTTRPA